MWGSVWVEVSLLKCGAVCGWSLCSPTVGSLQERALQIKTFLYIKITPVPLLISYHGRQGGIPIDIDNFKVSIPTLEYHNCNWTWKDLFMAIKRDCKQAIVPKVRVLKTRAVLHCLLGAVTQVPKAQFACTCFRQSRLNWGWNHDQSIAKD